MKEGERAEAIDTNCLEEKNQGRGNQSRKGAESRGEQFLVLLLRCFSSVQSDRCVDNDRQRAAKNGCKKLWENLEFRKFYLMFVQCSKIAEMQQGMSCSFLRVNCNMK